MKKLEEVERWAEVFLKLEKLKEEQRLQNCFSIDCFVKGLAAKVEYITPEQIAEEISKAIKHAASNRRKDRIQISQMSICLFKFKSDDIEQTEYLKILEKIVSTDSIDRIEKIKLYVFRKKAFATKNTDLVKIFAIKTLLIQLQSLGYKPYFFADLQNNKIVIGIGIVYSFK